MTCSTNHSSCPVFTNTVNRVLLFMRFWKSWPASLELQGMLGGCQPIILPLSWAVNEWKVALPKQGELSNNNVMPVPKTVHSSLICHGLWSHVLRPCLVRIESAQASKVLFVLFIMVNHQLFPLWDRLFSVVAYNNLLTKPSLSTPSPLTYFCSCYNCRLSNLYPQKSPVSQLPASNSKTYSSCWNVTVPVSGSPNIS